jgi:hypothetical protein
MSACGGSHTQPPGLPPAAVTGWCDITPDATQAPAGIEGAVFVANETDAGCNAFVASFEAHRVGGVDRYVTYGVTAEAEHWPTDVEVCDAAIDGVEDGWVYAGAAVESWGEAVCATFRQPGVTVTMYPTDDFGGPAAYS